VKKILVLHNSYRQYGGEDAAVEDEVNLLKNEYHVAYLNFKNETPNSIQEINGLFFNFNNESTKKILAKINTFKPDYLYLHNSWYKISLSIFEISKKMNIPLVLKVHNFRYDCANSLHFRKGKACHACTPEKRSPGILNRCYDNSFFKSLVITNYSKKYFEKMKTFDFKILLLNNFHYEYIKDLGVSKEKIYVIPNPIDNVDNNLIKKIHSNKTAIYAGRLSEEKGVENLLNAWKDSNAKKNHFRIKIIGDGPLKPKLESKFKNDESIIFTGYQTREFVKMELINSIFAITATQTYENQPMLLFEASRLGVPSIFPNYGGISDFFPTNYELSYEQFNFTELVYKINFAIDNIPYLKTLGLNNKNFVEEKFSNKNILEYYRRVFSE
jgi:glycosyltransferase involved in cell wall biosynthesis